METPSKPKLQSTNLPASVEEAQMRYACAATETAAIPPSGNTGGKFTPPLPLRPTETYEITSNGYRIKAIATPMRDENVPDNAALTDYLCFTFQFAGTPEAVSDFFKRISPIFNGQLGSLKSRNKGFEGYETSFQFETSGVVLAYGGIHQRGTAYVSIPGQGCALVADWGQMVDLLQNILDAKITRWDGAYDDYLGVHNVDIALEWYQAGLFGTGGNRPKLCQIGNWVEPDGTGRTINIGKRENGKVLRIYEKGKQLKNPDSPWTRWEIELRSKDRYIPFDVLLTPGKYLAGSYNCLHWVHEEACRIRTTRETAIIGYEHLVACARIAYGPLLTVMLAIEGSAEAVIKRLATPGHPRRLDLANVDLSAEGLYPKKKGIS